LHEFNQLEKLKFEKCALQYENDFSQRNKKALFINKLYITNLN